MAQGCQKKKKKKKKKKGLHKQNSRPPAARKGTTVYLDKLSSIEASVTSRGKKGADNGGQQEKASKRRPITAAAVKERGNSCKGPKGE